MHLETNKIKIVFSNLFRTSEGNLSYDFYDVFLTNNLSLILNYNKQHQSIV